MMADQSVADFQAKERDTAHKRQQKADSNLAAQHEQELSDMADRHAQELKDQGFEISADHSIPGRSVGPPAGPVHVEGTAKPE
jgi:hypothetical protein